MTTVSKIYEIDKHKQLIPLNGENWNFVCFFEVTSQDKKPFQISICEQGEIKPKEYQSADQGYINGKVESNREPKSYFLVLKAKEPCQCEVKLTLENKNEELTSNEDLSPFQNQTVQNQTVQNEGSEKIKILIIILVLLVISYLGYRYFSTKKNESLLPSVSNFSF